MRPQLVAFDQPVIRDLLHLLEVANCGHGCHRRSTRAPCAPGHRQRPRNGKGSSLDDSTESSARM